MMLYVRRAMLMLLIVTVSGCRTCLDGLPAPEPSELVGEWVGVGACAAYRLSVIDETTARLTAIRADEMVLRVYDCDDWRLEAAQPQMLITDSDGTSPWFVTAPTLTAEFLSEARPLESLSFNARASSVALFVTIDHGDGIDEFLWFTREDEFRKLIEAVGRSDEGT